MNDNRTEILTTAKLIYEAFAKHDYDEIFHSLGTNLYKLKIAVQLMEAMPSYEHAIILKTIFREVADVAEQDNQGEHLHE